MIFMELLSCLSMAVQNYIVNTYIVVQIETLKVSCVHCQGEKGSLIIVFCGIVIIFIEM